MPESLDPHIIDKFDSTKSRNGRFVDVTILRFMIGRFGPFETELPREHTRFDIEQAFTRERQKLDGIV